MTTDQPTPVSDAASELLASLEPDNVEGYTLAIGNAFEGVRCEGYFRTWEEAAEYMNEYFNEHYQPNRALDDIHIVTLWKKGIQT